MLQLFCFWPARRLFWEERTTFKKNRVKFPLKPNAYSLNIMGIHI